MTCDREMLLLISTYSDGEATPEEAERAAEHLVSCSDCRNMVEQWQGHQQLFTWAYTREITDGCSADDLIRLAGKEKPMTEQVVPRMVAQERKTNPAVPRRWAWAAAVAAGLLIVLLAYQIITAKFFFKVGQEILTAASPKKTRMTLDIDLTVGPNSKVSCIDERTIRVEKGWVAATVRGGSGITVTTPRMTVIDRGTKFHAGTGMKADYVTVEEGAVDVTARDTQRTVNASEAVLVSDDGISSVLALPEKRPGDGEAGTPLRDYHFDFTLPCTAEQLDWNEGIRRLAKRFPDLQVISGTIQGINHGNRLDSVIGYESVPGAVFQQAIRRHLPQIAQVLAGGSDDEGWEIPVGVMQLIGITNPSGLTDDLYCLRLVPMADGFAWRFTGSYGNEVDVPATFQVPQKEMPFQGFNVLGGVRSESKYSENHFENTTIYAIADWPGATKPLLELRVDGPQQLAIWQDKQAQVARLARECASVSGLTLEYPYCELFYLDTQRKDRMMIAWNTDAGQQLVRMSDLAKTGRGGSAALAAVYSDVPLANPAADAGTYLLRCIVPAAAQAPYLELVMPAAARAGTRGLVLSHEKMDDNGGHSFGYSTKMPPTVGAVDLGCTIVPTSENTFAFQLQVIGHPDDESTRPRKQGNVTSQRIPTKVWAEGSLHITKP